MPPALIKGPHCDHLINALIPLTVACLLSQGSRPLGLLALFTWIVLQLLSRIIALAQNGAGRETWMSWGLLLGLMLFNVRNIVLRDDHRGPVIFLLIGTGMLLGSQFNQRQWKGLLAWLAFSIVPIGLFFTIQLGPPGEWLAPAGDCYGHEEASVLFCSYYEHVQSSMGSINRLATLTTFLSLSAWYSSTIAARIWPRLAYLLIATLGYWIILGTDSRMAVATIPIAILLPWLGLRVHHNFTVKHMLISVVTVSSLLAFAAWEWVIKAGLGSDVMRIRMATCWIRKGMFSSLERFWMGSGYETDKLREACEFVRPGESFGHAHNTMAHIAGNHGLLGLIGLFAFTALVVHGLRRQRPTTHKRMAWSPWRSTDWAEISFGFNLALLFCALSTTVQIASPMNQLLIGLVAGSACVKATVDISPQVPDEVNP